MDPGEARAVHHAIAVAVELLDTVKCPPAAPLYGQGDTLARVARRLDHEIRHA